MRWTLWIGLATAACAASQNEAPEAPAEVAPATVTVTTASEAARAAYEAALVAQDNFRTVDAVTGFEQALIEDPEFALAKARLGALTPGNDGVLWLRQAAEDAEAQELPEAEHTLIRALLAFAEGDQARGDALMEKVTALAPGEWRAHLQVGATAYFEEDYERAREALEQAVALRPEAGPAWNMLGYTRAELGTVDSAVEAFERYASLAPGEANPHDSIGEVLMRAGRYEEAAAAFQKAIELDDSFHIGWMGLAQTRFLSGDEAGGLEALDQAADAALRVQDRNVVLTARAWALEARGDVDAARTAMAQVAQDAAEAKLHGQYVFNAITAGNMAALRGDWERARAAFDEAEERLEVTGLTGGQAKSATASARLGRAYVLARQGEAEQAATHLPDVDALLARQPVFEATVRMARAAIDEARGDLSAAIEELAACGHTQHRCLHDLARVQEAAGNTEAAAETRAAIRALNARSPSYLPVWVAAGP